MARRVLSWALVLFVAWTAGPATAQTVSPLKAIPGNAALVLRVKGFKGTLEKLAKLADAVEPNSGNQIKFGGAFLGAGIENPTMEGVDQAGDFYVAVFAEKDSQPATLFAIPGKDLEAMEEALGEEVTFVKQGQHGFYSKEEDVIEKVKEQVKSKDKTSLGDAIDEASMAVFNRGDVSVFINVKAVLSTNKEQFEFLKSQTGMISSLTPPGDSPSGVDMGALMGKLKDVVDGLLVAIEDHEGISVGLSISDKDLTIEKLFKLKADSKTGKSLKGGSGSDLALLNSLPGESLGYYALQCNLSSLLQYSVDFSTAVVTDEKAKEAIKATAGDLKNLKFNGLAGSFNLAKGDSGIFSMANLISTDDPKKLRTLSQKYAAAFKEFEVEKIKTEMTLKQDAEKIGANSIDVTTVKVTIPDDAPQADQQKAMQKLFYGSEGATARTAYLKDKVVQVTGGGKAAMEATLKAVEASSRTPAASIQAVRSKLGTKPNFVGLVDLASLAVKFMSFAKDLNPDAPIPDSVEKIADGLSLKPSYIGLGIEVQDAAISTKTVIPVEQMKSIGQVVKKAIAVSQEGN